MQQIPVNFSLEEIQALLEAAGASGKSWRPNLLVAKWLKISYFG
jgi:hypothetical protein